MAAAATSSGIPSDNGGSPSSPIPRRHANSSNARQQDSSDDQRRNRTEESSFLSSLWSLLPGNGGAPLHPEAEARQFQQMMNTEYGRCAPDFLEMSFRGALTHARDNFQVLVVYLHSSEHQDTDEFCKNSLCTDATKAVLEQENCSIWGGDVTCPQGFMAMQEFAATSFPFIGVYRPAGSSSFNRIASSEGYVTKEQLNDIIQRAINSARTSLEAMRAEQIAAEYDRNLREEQNRRYQEALERDQARERERQEEEERKKIEEAQKQSRIEAKQQEVDRAHQRVLEHPEPDKSEPGVISLRFTFPNGSKVGRRFRKHEPLQLLRDYSIAMLKNLGVLAGDIELANSFPKKTWSREDPGWDVSIEAAEIPSQAALFVKAVDVEDEDDEEETSQTTGGAS